MRHKLTLKWHPLLPAFCSNVHFDKLVISHNFKNLVPPECFFQSITFLVAGWHWFFGPFIWEFFFVSRWIQTIFSGGLIIIMMMGLKLQGFLWCWWLAKFGYMSDRKVEKIKNPAIFLQHAWTHCLNRAISKKSSFENLFFFVEKSCQISTYTKDF